MAKTSILKRREIRSLEAKRDMLTMKRDMTQRNLAEVRAALKKRRGQT